ncbi:transglycosylase SLT domain-containing protein [Nitrospirillum amazonense]|uniref:transglycosylase SLT domain-containing protein n=1 Tax=Nitrospirillum amazonense TaxID=28077 RepID=UPI003BB04AD7
MPGRRTHAAPAALAALAACFIAATAHSQQLGCLDEVRQQAPAHGVPLIYAEAVTRAESGGGGEPNPLALNIDGNPVFRDSRQKAEIALLVADSTHKSVDAGCMQIHVSAHRSRVSDIRTLFDPAVNVRIGLTLLAELHSRYGSWPKAVGAYNTARNAVANLKYRCYVATFIDPLFSNPKCKEFQNAHRNGRGHNTVSFK